MVNWTFTEPKQTFVMNLENSALTHIAGKLSDDADVSVTLNRATFDAISLKQRTFLGAVATGDLWVTGNPLKLRELFALFDEFSPDFEVVEPVKAKLEYRATAADVIWQFADLTAVIARSAATKQSRSHDAAVLDCFASLGNDGVGRCRSVVRKPDRAPTAAASAAPCRRARPVPWRRWCRHCPGWRR